MQYYENHALKSKSGFCECMVMAHNEEIIIKIARLFLKISNFTKFPHYYALNDIEVLTSVIVPEWPSGKSRIMWSLKWLKSVRFVASQSYAWIWFLYEEQTTCIFSMRFSLRLSCILCNDLDQGFPDFYRLVPPRFLE